jgi:hypothetical protein
MASDVLSIPQFNRIGVILLKLVVHYISRHQDQYQNLYANCFPAMAPKSLLVFINAHRKFCKRTDTVIAFTQEYSRVSYLSTGKQWLKRLIIRHHVSTNLIHQLD